MVNREWQGGKRDARLYAKVRTAQQKVVRDKYDRLREFLDERSRRLWVANEALAFGYGGIRAVAEALGISTKTVVAGCRELKAKAEKAGEVIAGNRQRRAGGGRKRLLEHDPGIVNAIEAIVDPATRGDPMNPLKWTSKSLVKIREELKQQGRPLSVATISEILRRDLKYSLQALKKTKEGSRQHPDRDAQFQYVNQQCRDFQQRGQPVISVDAKKKELIGDFKNGGREWHPQGEARTRADA
jgi:hypothetical protein